MPVQAVFLLNIEHGKAQLWEENFLNIYEHIKQNDGLSALLKYKSHERFVEEFIKSF